MTVRELVRCVSATTDRFVAENDSARGARSVAVICREGPAYYTIPGVAQMARGATAFQAIILP